jgi:hypothetical protein
MKGRTKNNNLKGVGRPCLGCWLGAGRQLAVAHRPRVDAWIGSAWSFFWEFFLFFSSFPLHFGQYFTGSLGNGPGLLGEWVHSTPIFSSFPLHLEVSNSSIPHRDWRFYFFGTFIFPKFRVDLDLHIRHSDFHFMEN